MNEKDFIVSKSWLLESKQNFAKRFNIEIYDDMFYNRCISAVSKLIDNKQNFNALSSAIFDIVGEINVDKIGFAKIVIDTNNMLNFNFKNTKLYNLLISLSNDKDFLRFIEAIEYIINFYCKEKDESILESFNDFATISNKNIRLCYDEKYRFYPKGVEIFDKKLINDILEFLQPYKKAHKELSEALQAFLKKSYRDSVDKTRLALEIFLKELLDNEKQSLENQKDDLFKYFGNDMHQNIKSMFLQIMDFYAKYNNNEAKHNSGDFKEYEVEFLFYLVGNFIRLLMQIKKYNKYSELANL